MKTSIALVAFILCQQFAFAQHDGARDAVRHIANGKFGQVTKTLQTKKPFAGDAESAFVEMLNLLVQDKPEDAFAKAREAEELGLPFERLLVGPREQLSKLHQLKAFQDWKSDENPSPLVHGPMVGNVTATSASIWVRTDGEAKVDLLAKGGTFISDSKRTSKAFDYTAVLSFHELSPGQNHSYRVVVNGKSVAEGSFHTSPRSGESGKFSVGFGGGAGFVPEWEYMWKTIRKSRPDAFLMLGDNVYIDLPESRRVKNICRTSTPVQQRSYSFTRSFRSAS